MFSANGKQQVLLWQTVWLGVLSEYQQGPTREYECVYVHTSILGKSPDASFEKKTNMQAGVLW